MICSAVGICEITDLKREKNSVATSNSPFSYSSMILLPTCSACSKPSVFTRSSITSMICDAYCRRSWSAPLRPTQRILTVLPAAVSALIFSRASRTIDELNAPHRPRSAVQTTSR